MDKSLLKEIILEQTKILETKEEGIPRKIIFELKKYFKLPHSLVISGMRRVGKSTLLLQLIHKFFAKNCYYFNFEDERLLNFAKEDFNNLYELLQELFGERKTFFFDEVQNVTGWENFVRRMQENGFKFFLTGSNASMLSRELGTKLTGRYIPIELYPFSFREYLDYKKYDFKKDSFYHTNKRAKIKRLFNIYLRDGGMPEYLKYKERDILVGTYEDILYRDIVARYDIKEDRALRELALYYLTNIATLVSFNKLKEVLKLGSVNTVKNYTQYLENSYLIFSVNLYSYSLAQQFIAPKKIYSLDNGLIEAISFRFSKDQGRFLENMVFMELKRRGEEIYYYKTKNGSEIDFVLKQGRGIKKVIQVAQNLTLRETKEREVKSMITALSELKLKDGLILTEDNKEIIKIDNKTITIKPIYQWLLE